MDFIFWERDRKKLFNPCPHGAYNLEVGKDKDTTTIQARKTKSQKEKYKALWGDQWRQRSYLVGRLKMLCMGDGTGGGVGRRREMGVMKKGICPTRCEQRHRLGKRLSTKSRLMEAGGRERQVRTAVTHSSRWEAAAGSPSIRCLDS